MTERISSQHGFEALRLQLKREFKEDEPSTGAQDGGAIDKVLGDAGSLNTLRRVVNEHDDRLERVEVALRLGPFGRP